MSKAKGPAALLLSFAMAGTMIATNATPNVFAAPTGQPEQICTPSTTDFNLTEGSMNWGVRDSFMKYLLGPISRGAYKATDGAQAVTKDGAFDHFTFKQTNGTYNASTKQGEIRLSGNLHLTGHHNSQTDKDELDVTLANPIIKINGDKAVVSFESKANKFGTPTIQNYNRIDVAQMTGIKVNNENGHFTISGNTTLTEDGASKAFAGFYQPGGELAPISATANSKGKDVCKPKPAAPTQPVNPTPTQPSPKPNPEAPQSCPNITKVNVTTPALEQTGLLWNLPKVFEKYAKDQGFEMRVDNATISAGAIVFNRNVRPVKNGDTLEVTFGGSFLFQRGNQIAFKLSNPKLVINKQNSADLWVTVTDAEGQIRTEKFATVAGPIYLDRNLASYGESLRMENGVVTLANAEDHLVPGLTAQTEIPPLTFRLDLYDQTKSFLAKDLSNVETYKTLWDLTHDCVAFSWVTQEAVTSSSAPTPKPIDSEIVKPTIPSVEEENRGWNDGDIPAAKTGTLVWGIKKSWRSYIGGGVTLSEGAQASKEGYIFHGGTVTNETNGTKTVQYNGKVNFKAYGGILYLTFSDPQVRIDQQGKATLWLKQWNANQDGTSETPGQYIEAVKIADVQNAGAANPSAVNSATYLQEPLQQQFIYAYRTGLRMSNLSFTTKDVKEPGATPTAPTSPKQPVAPESPAAPANPAKPAAPTGQPTAITMTDGNLEWAVRDSFNTYIKGIAQGTWETSDGASWNDAKRVFSFKQTGGSYDMTKHSGTISWAGRVHYTGHHGALDTTFMNPTLNFQGTQGVLSFHVIAKTMSGPIKDLGRINIVNVKLARPSIKSNTMTIDGTTTLTADASANAFGGSYPAGKDMAPLHLTAQFKMGGAPTTPTQPRTPAQPGTPAHPANPIAPVLPAPTQPTQPSTSANGEQLAKAEPIKHQCTPDTSQYRVTSGDMNWGLRTSFTTYIRGIAHGNWDLSGGVNWSGGQFHFPVASGMYNSTTRKGTINYSGTIHFTGHGGVLDMTVGNPTLVINGRSAQLYLSLTSSDMSGKRMNHGRVHFANVDLSGISVNGGKLNLNGSTVVLTAAGSKAFAGFYQPGEKLDAMSVNAKLAPGSMCDKDGNLLQYNASGKLVNTGKGGAGTLAATGGNTELLGISTLMLLCGAAMAAASRKRKANG